MQKTEKKSVCFSFSLFCRFVCWNATHAPLPFVCRPTFLNWMQRDERIRRRKSWFQLKITEEETKSTERKRLFLIFLLREQFIRKRAFQWRRHYFIIPKKTNKKKKLISKNIFGDFTCHYKWRIEELVVAPKLFNLLPKHITFTYLTF